MGLGSQNYIMFMPDGSSQDTLGNYNSGVRVPDPAGRSLQFARRLGVRHDRKDPRLAALQPGGEQVGAAMMPARNTARTERGFTLIEVMIAIVIMSVGILTVVAAFATAVASTQNAQQNLIARQKALEAMESIFTARNTQQITFAQIAQYSAAAAFSPAGATPLWSAGNDGLVNTADDLPFAAQGRLPGRAGVHHASRS